MGDQDHKCGHPVCDCMAEDDGDYCSEYCEDAVKAGIVEIGCGCEHQGCSG